MILNYAYGNGRRLRVVSWTISVMVSQSIQDSNIKKYWVREGAPDDATLVDVILHKSTQLGISTVNLVIEHETFPPVEAGEVIPPQPVVLLDVDGAMALFNERQRNDGA